MFEGCGSIDSDFYAKRININFKNDTTLRNKKQQGKSAIRTFTMNAVVKYSGTKA